MTDKSKLSQQQARGNEARALLTHPLITEFFAKVEDAAVRAWKGSDPDEIKLRESAYYRLQALEDLRMCFRKTISDGDHAAQELRRNSESEKKA